MFVERLRIHRIESMINTCLFRTVFLLDFKLSPCSVCCNLSFGWFPGVWILYSDVSEHSVSSIFIGGVSLHHLWRWTCQNVSETSAYKIHTPGNHPKERIYFLFCLLFKNRIKIYTKSSYNILVCVRVKMVSHLEGEAQMVSGWD